MSKKAFTLIELLVVIAIIAILAAILFPVFAQAKLAAKKTVDMSNGRQIGIAFTLYAGEWDDYFPLTSYPARENSWTEKVQPYIKSRDILRSPADQSTNWNAFDPLQRRMSSYFLNAYMNGAYGGGGSFATITSITNPSGTIYVAQSEDNITRDHFHPFHWGSPAETANGFMQNLTFDSLKNETKELKLRAFNDGQNYVYVDGHAKFGKWNQVWWRDLPAGVYAGNFDPRNQGRN